MKKILSIVLFSMIGGILTLGGYKLLIEQPNVIIKEQISKPATIQTNYLEKVNSI